MMEMRLLFKHYPQIRRVSSFTVYAFKVSTFLQSSVTMGLRSASSAIMIIPNCAKLLQTKQGYTRVHQTAPNHIDVCQAHQLHQTISYCITPNYTELHQQQQEHQTTSTTLKCTNYTKLHQTAPD